MTRDYGYLGGTHAEAKALSNSINGDTLIVVRVKKDGNFGCSKPCPKCFQMCIDFGIKKIYYVNWSGEVCLIKTNNEKDSIIAK